MQTEEAGVEGRVVWGSVSCFFTLTSHTVFSSWLLSPGDIQHILLDCLFVVCLSLPPPPRLERKQAFYCFIVAVGPVPDRLIPVCGILPRKRRNA